MGEHASVENTPVAARECVCAGYVRGACEGRHWQLRFAMQPARVACIACTYNSSPLCRKIWTFNVSMREAHTACALASDIINRSEALLRLVHWVLPIGRKAEKCLGTQARVACIISR
eukprot:2588618-Pleurochrysis_carterae.AAC.1